MKGLAGGERSREDYAFINTGKEEGGRERGREEEEEGRRREEEGGRERGRRMEGGEKDCMYICDRI